MVFLIWFIVILCFRPELDRVEGRREKAKALAKELGPLNQKEKFVIFTMIAIITLFMLKSFAPVKAFQDLDRGFCLWKTGAARWRAVHWLTMFLKAHWLTFVLGIALFVLIRTNFMMNVAAIAISLPVSLVIANYLGVAGHVILFASLVTAGMPFNLLIGAAPNAIAYESKQFTAGEFFMYGWVPSVVLMALPALFVYVIWPLMGMPVLIK